MVGSIWYAGLLLLGFAWGLMLRNNYICFTRYSSDVEEGNAIPRFLMGRIGLVGTFTIMTIFLFAFCVMSYFLEQYTFPGMLAVAFITADIYELNIVRSLKERENVRECLNNIEQIEK